MAEHPLFCGVINIKFGLSEINLMLKDKVLTKMKVSSDFPSTIKTIEAPYSSF